uniref:Uncharacterized protein n=1 Tax=Anguilla anguilla TaxID=7936 RepID=A0A0E9SH40_ANGAN
MHMYLGSLLFWQFGQAQFLLKQQVVLLYHWGSLANFTSFF